MPYFGQPKPTGIFAKPMQQTRFSVPEVQGVRFPGAIAPLSRTAQTMMALPAEGRLVAPTIDMTKRPEIMNPDGSFSSVRTMSFQDDKGRQVVVPTIRDDGYAMTPYEAMDQYKRTGQHLGIFKNPEASEKWENWFHPYEEQSMFQGSR